MSRISPILVSFYAGDESYYRAAESLRQDCVSLGLDHDIRELPVDPGQDWLSICRRKPAFCLEMLRAHRRPIMWLDVDSRLARCPSALEGAACDFAAFLRGFRYLRDFDPLAMPRFFAPFALYFNHSPAAIAFLELMVDLADRSTEPASDDYFLHEAWLHHRQQLSVLILPPDLVGHEWPLKDGQAIYVGISGNVSKFKTRARQHVIALLESGRRKAVLLYEAEEAMKRGETDESLTLYRRALAAVVTDDALAGKIARLLKRHRGPEEAESFLRHYRGLGE